MSHWKKKVSMPTQVGKASLTRKNMIATKLELTSAEEPPLQSYFSEAWNFGPPSVFPLKHSEGWNYPEPPTLTVKHSEPWTS